MSLRLTKSLARMPTSVLNCLNLGKFDEVRVTGSQSVERSLSGVMGVLLHR